MEIIMGKRIAVFLLAAAVCGAVLVSCKGAETGGSVKTADVEKRAGEAASKKDEGAAEAEKSSGAAETEKTGDAVEAEKTGNAADAEKEIRILFVGNSITYYNNMPEMYKRILSASRGTHAAVDTVMYSTRKIKEQGKAVSAVIRTKGDSKKLTEEEKTYFYYFVPGTGEEGHYDEEVYDLYKHELLDEKDRKKDFDYIILQDHGREQTFEDSNDGVRSLIRAMSSDHTRVIVTMPNYAMDENLSVAKKTQDQYDRVAERIVDGIKKDPGDLKYESLEIAYIGRAMHNYLFYFGSDTGMKRSPADYSKKIYKDSYPAESDIMMEGRIHNTQLGSYLQAATIYSTVYNESAEKSVEDYRAEVDHKIIAFNNKKSGYNFAIQNGPYRDPVMLKAACFIADQTANHKMNFRDEKDVMQWKQNKNRENDIIS